jgi:bifunctional DNA-binding transcriptional regulator/antitoxin component of YhaV-PrlF toxin-antitoxin module
MANATLMFKVQTTIPKEIRDSLGHSGSFDA